MADQNVIAKLVEHSGLSFKRNSLSYILDCPRCGKKDKLYIRRKDGRFVCWYCKEIDNFQGKPEYALSELLGLPIAELKKAIYGFENDPIELHFEVEFRDFYGYEDEIDEDLDANSVLRETTFPPDYYPIEHKHARKGLEYLEGRDIPLEVAKRYQLAYCPTTKRVIFPIYMHGKLYGWQGRTIGETSFFSEDLGRMVEIPKYLGNANMKREQLVMFHDRLIGSEHAIVTEGPTDAIKADLCGGNIATMGKAISKKQIQILRGIGIRKYYLALDPDAAEEVDRLVSANPDLEFYNMIPEGVKDLGKMSYQDVLELKRGAKRLTNANIVVFFKLPKFYALRPKVADSGVSGVL